MELKVELPDCRGLMELKAWLPAPGGLTGAPGHRQIHSMVSSFHTVLGDKACRQGDKREGKLNAMIRGHATGQTEPEMSKSMGEPLSCPRLAREFLQAVSEVPINSIGMLLRV